MIYAAIDLGKEGAIVSLSPDGQTVLLAEPCPLYLDRIDVRAMATIGDRLRAIDPVIFLAVEKPIGKKRNGRTDSGYKALLTNRRDWLTALRMEPDLEPVPVVWQKMLVGVQAAVGGSTKAKSIAFCRVFATTLDLMPGKRSVPADGLADAFCLAEWGRRQHRLQQRSAT